MQGGDMHATVSWNGMALDDTTSGLSFTAVTGSGHVLAMDGAPADAGSPLGGKNLAPRPMEVVLAGTGGCTAYDVVMILRRGRHAVSRCEVSLKAERAPTDPKVFTAIHFHFIVVGHDLKHEVVDRAIKLSHEKLCSASVMLKKTAVLTHSFEIRAG
jgi:putative redox protein